MASAFIHETVLLDEAVESLAIRSGLYVDATFGRGGHSRKILGSLPDDAILLVIDKDPEAIAVAEAMRAEDSRVEVFHGSFAQIDEALLGRKVSGVLADLGVSSPQLDDADRGFSFMNDGPLDMRMNTQAGLSASEWLGTVNEVELAQVLRDYGEEKFAKRIAKAIVAEHKINPITTTSRLAAIASEANPSWEKHKHPATRVFQAIRIAVNRELEDLETFLRLASDSLEVGGRLVVISFHSLEDRMVKRYMRDLCAGAEPPKGVPVLESDISRPFKLESKAIKASKAEVERNPRSRSAVMRTIERVGYAA